MRKLRGLVLAILAITTPSTVFAQADGTVHGNVVDESKAVLPGATLTLTELTTGRHYVAVTDVRGEYRLVNVAAGTYKLEAELSGFASTIIPKLELLVGQNANVAITLKLATVQENVTVTGETPLVDTRSSHVSANVDRRQMEELPLQGRNWIELSLLAKGVTGNSADNSPGVRERDFNLSLTASRSSRTASRRRSGSRSSAAARSPSFARHQSVRRHRTIDRRAGAGGRGRGMNQTSGAFYGYSATTRSTQRTRSQEPCCRENQQIGGASGD